MHHEILPLSGRKVLVIDDSKDITSLLADVFADVGAGAVQANTGRDAMRFLALCEFDLIVLDMVMSQPDGWALLRYMRRKPSYLKHTIVLTANCYNQWVQDTIREYSLPCMYKPFDLKELLTLACHIVSDAMSTTAA
jgi:DNA-binding NtrC family response regulator